MCGRYGLAVSLEEIVRRFGIGQGSFDLDMGFEPRYNIAPSQAAPVITGDGRLKLMRWGYEPSWMRVRKDSRQLINAQAEGLAISRAFKRAFAQDRIIVPASMWYEWSRDRTPNLFKLKGGDLFGLAGLRFHQDGEESYVIITTEANEVSKRIHNRQPALLRPDDEATWLSPDETDADRLGRMLLPVPAAWMESHPVSRKLNSPANDSAELIQPIS